MMPPCGRLIWPSKPASSSSNFKQSHLLYHELRRLSGYRLAGAGHSPFVRVRQAESFREYSELVEPLLPVAMVQAPFHTALLPAVDVTVSREPDLRTARGAAIALTTI